MAVQSIQIPQSLAYVLNRAGSKNDVDFDYLVQTAMRESSLNPHAKASTSSAVGLFQFLKSTWLEVMKEEGPRLGYEQYANAIVKGTNGNYYVPDKREEHRILALREDPQIAADLAAAFTRRNGEYLHQQFGRMPSPGELYIAHFLGARGAAKMFRAGLDDPDQIAAKLFPAQADANQAIFYANGEPRTIRQVYMALVSKHETTGVTDNAAFAAQQMAGTSVSGEPLALSFTSMFSTSNVPSTGSPVSVPEKRAGGFFTNIYKK